MTIQGDTFFIYSRLNNNDFEGAKPIYLSELSSGKKIVLFAVL